MLRSLDHVGRSAGRRAVARNGRPVASPGLDLAGWLRRSRERFLASYRAGLREAGVPIALDPTLLRLAFVSTTEGATDGVPGEAWQRLLYDAAALTSGT